MRFFLIIAAFALIGAACSAIQEQETADAPPAPSSSIDSPTPSGPTATRPPAEKSPSPTAEPITAEEPPAAVLPIIGPAPEWHNDVWINSDTPLTLEDLRGKVVLLEFWTFG